MSSLLTARRSPTAICSGTSRRWCWKHSRRPPKKRRNAQIAVRIPTRTRTVERTIAQWATHTLTRMMSTLRIRLRDRIQDPHMRRSFGAYFGGKLIGLGAVLAAIYGITWYFGTQVGASVLRDTAVKAGDIVNPVNTVWTLVTAFLVFFMQAGFMMLEGGFARTREVSNIMIECIADTAMCGILFWAFGFAL